MPRKGQKHSQEAIKKIADSHRKPMVELTCTQCGNNYLQYPYRALISFNCSKSCMFLSMRGKKAWNKGLGTKYDMRGYKTIPVTKQLEHRKIMCDALGREMGKKEVVHHCDKNKKNNSLNNLQYFKNHAAHKRLHHFAARHKIDMILLRFEQPWLEKANQITL